MINMKVSLMVSSRKVNSVIIVSVDNKKGVKLSNLLNLEVLFVS